MAWGKNLREKREELGYSLEYVEEETKIRKYYLEALENDHFSLLPPKIYASGFVKQYARLLGFDEKQLVDEFKRLAYGDAEDDNHIVIEQSPAPREESWFRIRNVAFALIFLVLAVWFGNYIVNYLAQEGTRNIGPGIVQQGPQPGVEDNDKATQKDPTVKIARIEIEAQQKCWVWVKVDNETAFTGTLEPGEYKEFEGKQSVYIKAGNAGGIKITFNDRAEGTMGMPGEVKEQEFQAKIR